MRASQHESLAYIQSMTRELVDIAKGARLDMLAYLLEMAYFEASDQMREQWQEKNLPSDCLARYRILAQDRQTPTGPKAS